MASNFPSTSDPGPSEVFSNSSGDESDFIYPSSFHIVLEQKCSGKITLDRLWLLTAKLVGGVNGKYFTNGAIW